AQRTCILGKGARRLFDFDRILPEIGEPQRAAYQAPVRVRVGTHTPGTPWRQFPEFGNEPSGFIEEFLGTIGAQPAFEHLQMFGVLANSGQRHLVGAPEFLDLMTVHLFRSGPSFRTAQHDHWPTSPFRFSSGARLRLYTTDLKYAVLQCRCHL